MSDFTSATCSVTRFSIDPETQVTPGLLSEVPNLLKQFAFTSIDDIPEQRGYGWTNFDNMLDTTWQDSPPEKADVMTFSFRIDTRRINSALFKKHFKIALAEEEARRAAQGQQYISRARFTEIKEQVKLRLLSRTMPIPSVFQVVWDTQQDAVYLACTRSAVIDLFTTYFEATFGVRLVFEHPLSVLQRMFANNGEVLAAADNIQPTIFDDDASVDYDLDSNAILGREFLTWLWCYCDQHPDLNFQDLDLKVDVGQRIVVRSKSQLGPEFASVAGSMGEAKAGLRFGKKVVQAGVIIKCEEATTKVIVNADSFCFSSLKTPKVTSDPDDDPDADLILKIDYIRQFFEDFDSLYRRFLLLRLNESRWEQEISNISQWMRQ